MLKDGWCVVSRAEKQHGGFLREQLAAQEQKERVVLASFACL